MFSRLGIRFFHDSRFVVTSGKNKSVIIKEKTKPKPKQNQKSATKPKTNTKTPTESKEGFPWE